MTDFVTVPDDGLLSAAENLRDALAQSTGRALFVSPYMPEGPLIRGRFEIRDCRGRIKRLQNAVLELPKPLFRIVEAVGLPTELVRIETEESGGVTLWPLKCFIELQVGFRWHGFSGRPIEGWDPDFTVIAESDGAPFAMRLSLENGPVFYSKKNSINLRELEPRFQDLKTFLNCLAQEVRLGAPVHLTPASEMS